MRHSERLQIFMLGILSINLVLLGIGIYVLTDVSAKIKQLTEIQQSFIAFSSPRLASCPKDKAEVSMMIGVTPEYWTEIMVESTKTYYFKTSQFMSVTGPYIGSLVEEQYGGIVPAGKKTSLRAATYICTDSSREP